MQKAKSSHFETISGLWAIGRMPLVYTNIQKPLVLSINLAWLHCVFIVLKSVISHKKTNIISSSLMKMHYLVQWFSTNQHTAVPHVTSCYNIFLTDTQQVSCVGAAYMTW